MTTDESPGRPSLGLCPPGRQRGLRGAHPGRLPAALADGADGVECDVHLTRDQHAVLLHDANLDRTSDGTGPVAERTIKELRLLDFSSWRGARIPAGIRRPLGAVPDPPRAAGPPAGCRPGHRAGNRAEAPQPLPAETRGPRAGQSSGPKGGIRSRRAGKHRGDLHELQPGGGEAPAPVRSGGVRSASWSRTSTSGASAEELGLGCVHRGRAGERHEVRPAGGSADAERLRGRDGRARRRLPARAPGSSGAGSIPGRRFRVWTVDARSDVALLPGTGHPRDHHEPARAGPRPAGRGSQRQR